MAIDDFAKSSLRFYTPRGDEEVRGDRLAVPDRGISSVTEVDLGILIQVVFTNLGRPFGKLNECWIAVFVQLCDRRSEEPSTIYALGRCVRVQRDGNQRYQADQRCMVRPWRNFLPFRTLRARTRWHVGGSSWARLMRRFADEEV